jgi:signal transduction histidine kinase
VVVPDVENRTREDLLLTLSLMLGERLYLFARLRFLAAAGILIGGPFAKYVVGIAGLDLWSLSGLALFLAASNVAGFLVVRPYRRGPHGKPDQSRLVWVAHGSILLDYLVLTVAIWLVGGANSPFRAFYLLHAILAAVLLSRRAAYALAAVGYLCLAGLVLGEWSGLLPKSAAVSVRIDDQEMITVLVVYGVLTLVTALLTTGVVRLLRENEQGLRVARERLERLADLRRSFLHVVLHDVRGPVGTVVAMLEGMSGGIDGDLTPPQGLRVGRARARLSSLLDLLRGLRVLADLETETLDKLMVPVDLRKTITATIDDHLDAAEQKKQSMKTELPETLPVVRGVERLLREALANYLSNAIKYTNAGGAIIVRALVEGAMVRVEVSDNGPGIATEDQARLFREFSRAGRDGSRHGKAAGLGLGLSIVRRIAEAHEGRAGVESKPGQGSTFFILLPIASPTS